VQKPASAHRGPEAGSVAIAVWVLLEADLYPWEQFGAA